MCHHIDRFHSQIRKEGHWESFRNSAHIPLLTELSTSFDLQSAATQLAFFFKWKYDQVDQHHHQHCPSSKCLAYFIGCPLFIIAHLATVSSNVFCLSNLHIQCSSSIYVISVLFFRPFLLLGCLLLRMSISPNLLATALLYKCIVFLGLLRFFSLISFKNLCPHPHHLQSGTDACSLWSPYDVWISNIILHFSCLLFSLLPWMTTLLRKNLSELYFIPHLLYSWCQT